MIKKLIYLIATLFLIVPNAVAFMGPAVAGGGMPVAGGPSYILGPMDFESGTYSTGELGGQDSWAEETASTDYFLIQNSLANSGSQAISARNGAVQHIYRLFTGQTGTFTIDFYIASADVSEASVRFGFADGNSETTGNQGSYMRITANDLEIYTSIGWVDPSGNSDVFASDATFYHIELQVDANADTITNCWINGSAYTNGAPWTFRNAQAEIDRFFIEAYPGVYDIYIDDLAVYAGARQ